MNNKNFFSVLLIILLFFQYRFVYVQGRSRVKSLDKVIENKKTDLETLSKLCAEYTEKRNSANENRIRIAEADFSLFSYVSRILTKQGIEKKITGIQPFPVSEKEGFLMERLNLSVQNITLKQLYNFLLEIENSNNPIYIPGFRMLKNKENPSFLNIEIDLVVIKVPST